MSVGAGAFRGIVSIDKEQVAQLRLFLEEHERVLAVGMVRAFGIKKAPDTISEAFRLIEAHITQKGPWAGLIDTLNGLLWDYLNVLESTSAELFHVLERLLLCDWTPELWEAILAFTETLKGHQQRLRHVIDRLEDLLWEYRWVADSEAPSNWLVRKLVRASQCLLDSDLGRNLYKAQRFLQTRYSAFADRYLDYARLKKGAEEAAVKVQEFRVFQRLNREARDSYLSIYQILRVWEQDMQGKSLLLEDLARVLKRGESTETVLRYLQIYFGVLREDLFGTSLEIKRGLNLTEAIERMRGAQRELQQLERFVARLREFLLRTDPNPYVRSRWGFAEWVMGPEPEVSKRLRGLEFDLEVFDRVYERFLASLTRGAECVETTSALGEIQRILHQMAQPMATKHAMQGYAEKLVVAIQGLDELGSVHMDVIGEMHEVLTKAMVADWRYVTLWGINEFHEIVAIHQQLSTSKQEPVKVSIERTLDSQMQQIVAWTHRGHVAKHMNEVDLLVAEWKDFLASERSEAQRFELRYQLGRFFYDLLHAGSEGQLVRDQFDNLERFL